MQQIMMARTKRGAEIIGEHIADFETLFRPAGFIAAAGETNCCRGVLMIKKLQRGFICAPIKAGHKIETAAACAIKVGVMK